MSTEISILHSPCCATQSPIKAQIEKIAKENNLEVRIKELTEIEDIMPYGVMSFPALVVNGKVYDYKKISSDKALLSIL